MIASYFFADNLFAKDERCLNHCYGKGKKKPPEGGLAYFLTVSTMALKASG